MTERVERDVEFEATIVAKHAAMGVPSPLRRTPS